MTKPTMVYLTMKGGVGKTTLAANVTRAIADTEKKKILLIDADSQCNLTQLFVDADSLDLLSDRTIYGALTSSQLFTPADLKERIYHNPANGSEIDLIRGSFETFRLAVDSTPVMERKTLERFKWFIGQAQADYDLIVIDTNPSATLVTMQALAVANFLVAPISFDKFSMRGIDLITNLLSAKHPWLRDPFRVRIIPNRIKNPTDARTQAKLLEAEQKVRLDFPDLSRCFIPAYIRESAIISNEARRNRFIAEQSVPNVAALKTLLDDFNTVATELLATFEQAFVHEASKPKTLIGRMRGQFPNIFGSVMDRP